MIKRWEALANKKCFAGKAAGAIVGLFAGAGAGIAIGNLFHKPRPLFVLVICLGALLGAIGGAFGGGAASDCWEAPEGSTPKPTR